LSTLSLEAAPPIVELYQSERASPEIPDIVGRWLAWRLEQLDRLRAGSTIFSANLSRDRAWALLDGICGDLPMLNRWKLSPLDFLW
jgi:hypothetical protein